jgi:hypothetical protein
MPRGRLSALATLAGTSGAAEDCGWDNVAEDDSGVGVAVVSLMITAVGSTDDVEDVTSVDDDDTGAGAGVADESGA